MESQRQKKISILIQKDISNIILLQKKAKSDLMDLKQPQ